MDEDEIGLLGGDVEPLGRYWAVSDALRDRWRGGQDAAARGNRDGSPLK